LSTGVVFESCAASAAFGGDALAVHLVPAIARQATAKLVDPRFTLMTARVAAGALRMLCLPAEVVLVEVTAYSRDAWNASTPERSGAAPPQAATARPAQSSRNAPHCCVQTDEVLIDASLDLLSVPGGSLTLRPSWFELPRSWSRHGYATFRQQQTGAVVHYVSAPRCYEAMDEDAGAGEVLLHRLVMEVVESCQTAQRALAGMAPAASRWLALSDAEARLTA